VEHVLYRVSCTPCYSLLALTRSPQNRSLFPHSYTCVPGQRDGAIYRIVSQTAGVAGIAGPYPHDNATIILDEEMGTPDR
jgi:hypothetical protein